MDAILTVLPWVIVWLIILGIQDRFIKKRNWFGSILLIWLSLVLSFVWDPIISFLLGDKGAFLQIGSHFWMLAIITAVLHFTGKRRANRNDTDNHKLGTTGKPPEE